MTDESGSFAAAAWEEVRADLSEIRRSIGSIETSIVLCGPCRDMVNRHEHEIYGNGHEGIKAHLAAIESRKGESKLSVKEMVKLIITMGALTGTIAAAIGATAAAVLK